MNLMKKLFAAALVFTFLVGAPSKPQARVMMTGSINSFFFKIMPTANFTLNDWLNTPGLWSITIMNAGGDGKSVKSAVVIIDISSDSGGRVVDV